MQQWYLTPMPDGDEVHEVAQSYRRALTEYSRYIQATQKALDDTIPIWAGPGSDAHARAAIANQRIATEHARMLLVLADALDILGTLLKITIALQLAWPAMRTGNVALNALVVDANLIESTAAEVKVEAVIVQVKYATTVLLQTLVTAQAASLARLDQSGAPDA